MSEKVLKNQLNNVSKTVEVSESLLGNEKSKCDLSHNAKILNVNAKFICHRYLMTGSLSAGFLVFVRNIFIMKQKYAIKLQQYI